MNTTRNILIGAVALLIILLVISHTKNKDKTCYSLPKNPDPAVFGPKYWAALHDIVGKIPCGQCRGFAEKFMVFFHDVVNAKLNRPLYAPENYSEMMIYLNSPKQAS